MQLKIALRSEWYALPYLGIPKEMKYFEYVVIHHSQGLSSFSLDASVKLLQNIQLKHQLVNLWDDIGYHYCIDSAGNVFQGREYYINNSEIPFPISVGAHVKNLNSGKIGICILGCYDPSFKKCSHIFTSAAFESLKLLCGDLCSHLKIPPKNIVGHNHFIETTCPGPKIISRLSEIQKYCL